MKIAQIIYTGFGGLGSVAFSLIEADKKREHQWLLAFTGDQILDASYPARCEQHHVLFGVFQSTAGKPFRAWVALAKWLADNRPDVVICHSINSILACRWYAWRHGARLLAVEHTANQVKTSKEWAASRMCMLLADRVVVLTAQYRKELQQVQGCLFRPSKVVTIGNGIDTDVFVPHAARLPLTDSVVRLGMAGRFSFSKRQELLVAMLEELQSLRPHQRFELRLAGDGAELAKVRQWAAQSPCAGSVVFDGLLAEQDMAQWMRSLDIYVHATNAETLSTSILQAMATGLPIVASDVEGVNNLLQYPEAYGLCVANSASDFARAVLQVLDHRQGMLRMAERSRQRICECHSNETMLQQYLDTMMEPRT